MHIMGMGGSDISLPGLRTPLSQSKHKKDTFLNYCNFILKSVETKAKIGTISVVSFT
jgi:hypothetical protein